MRSRLALGALALVLGFGAAAVPRLLSADGDEHVTNAARGNPRAIPTVPIEPRATGQAAPLGTAASEQPGAPASSPAEAVQSFLTAETHDDFDISYGLLASADRSTQRSRAGWTAAHAQLPVMRSFTIGAVRAAPERSEVDAHLALRPELDPVIGLVPDAMTATFVTLPEDGGWRVAFGDSALTPQYASETGAPMATRLWVRDRVGCRFRSAAGLLTTGRLTDQLCGARGPVRVGAPIALDPGPSSDRFLAAYGPDVFTWARVVPVTSPARVGAVLAPLGPRWRVIGLVELAASSSDPSPQPNP
jgi:hypothetical protein